MIPVTIDTNFDAQDMSNTVWVNIDGANYAAFAIYYRGGGHEIWFDSLERPTWTTGDAIRAIVRNHATYRGHTLEHYQFIP